MADRCRRRHGSFARLEVGHRFQLGADRDCTTEQSGRDHPSRDAAAWARWSPSTRHLEARHGVGGKLKVLDTDEEILLASVYAQWEGPISGGPGIFADAPFIASCRTSHRCCHGGSTPSSSRVTSTASWAPQMTATAGTGLHARRGCSLGWRISGCGLHARRCRMDNPPIHIPHGWPTTARTCRRS